MHKTITRIAVFGSIHKVDHAEGILAFVKELTRHAELLLERRFHTYLSRSLGLKLAGYELIDESDSLDGVDCAISIGGDGTFLRTAHRVGVKGTPIWGINSGSLGFLTDVDCDDAIALVPKLIAGEGREENRSLLKVETEAGYCAYVLNELAVTKRDSGSIITVDTYLDDHFLAGYDADGLIISTPSGSTAYSLSAGGPIVMPSCKNIVITPISPHTLNMRPIVVADSVEIRLEVRSRAESILVAADGNTVVLNCNNPIFLRRAPYDLYMLRLQDRPFAETIRRKLMWGAPLRS